MKNLESIEIRISGSKGSINLSPENYDIRDIKSILENAEKLIATGDSRNRPTISYKIEEGSVKHVFTTVLLVVGSFNFMLSQIIKDGNLDFLDDTRAKAFEYLQKEAVIHDYSIGIKTSLDDTSELVIDRNTSYYLSKPIWVDAEFYLYGKITNAGGKSKSNIHINTDEYGSLIVQTDHQFFENLSDNIVYKDDFGIRAHGKQNLLTGEIEPSSLKFIELVKYKPVYDVQYLQGLRDKAKQSWLGNINTEQWLNEIREVYDA